MWSVIVIIVIISFETKSLPIDERTGNIPESGRIHTPLYNHNENVKKSIQKSAQFQGITFSPPFPDSGRTRAVLESESIDSQIQTAYGRLHDSLAQKFNYQPIVDNISEKEKYLNDGEQHRVVATKIIAGIEGFSNWLNGAIEAPYEIAKQYGKVVMKSLNSLGGRVSGLA